MFTTKFTALNAYISTSGFWLNKYKAEQTENWTAVRSYGKQQPSNRRDRQMDTVENHNVSQQSSLWEPVSEEENLKYNWQIAKGLVWTNLRVKNRSFYRGALRLPLVHLQEFYQVLTENYQQKKYTQASAKVFCSS